MNDFDYDVKEKKRLARNAEYKKNGSKSRKCTMPDDYLTPAQRKKLNGPVTTYKLGEPMGWKTFNSMPTELQKEYIIKLREKFHVPDQQIADMMGVNKVTVGNRRRELGIKAEGRLRASAEQVKMFWDWVNQTRNPAPVEEPKPEGMYFKTYTPKPKPVETKPEEQETPATDPGPMPCELSFRMENAEITAGHIANVIRMHMLNRTCKSATITLTF